MKFSVVIPVFNVEQYIEECIMSVLNQDYPQDRYEIVVVDDCTPDNSMAIVERLAKDHSNIRIIHHARNLHLGGARNTGIREAKGDWIFFLDSDDKWVTTNVFKTFDELTEKTDGIDYVKSTSYSNSLDVRIISSRGNVTQSGYEYLRSNNYGCNVWMSCYRASFLRENHLYFREHVAYEDNDWAIKCAYNASKILIIDYPFYGYRSNPESISQNPNVKSFADNVTSAVALHEYIRKNVSDELFRKAAITRLRKIVVSFIKYSRNYEVSQSLSCINLITDKTLYTDIAKNSTFRDRFLITMQQHAPRTIFTVTRALVNAKRQLRFLMPN